MSLCFKRSVLAIIIETHGFELITCGVVNLRSSDVVPPLLLNFTQDQSGNVRFCCIDDTIAKLSSSGGTTSLDRRSTTPHVLQNLNNDSGYFFSVELGCMKLTLTWFHAKTN